MELWQGTGIEVCTSNDHGRALASIPINPGHHTSGFRCTINDSALAPIEINLGRSTSGFHFHQAEFGVTQATSRRGVFGESSEERAICQVQPIAFSGLVSVTVSNKKSMYIQQKGYVESYPCYTGAQVTTCVGTRLGLHVRGMFVLTLFSNW